jgi:aminopeptidase N
VTEHPASRSKTFHWKQEIPHSTYLISVVAGQFEKYGERAGAIPLEYYVPSGTGRDKAMQTFRETPAAVRFFEDRIGFPYPYAKYSQTTVQEFTFGGMENISATTLSDRTLHESASEPQSSSVDLVTHELAHQWFGDLLTCANWSHLWLNEGFATFWAAAYREHRDGWDQYLHEVFEDRVRYLDEDKQRYRRPLVTSYYSDPIDLFDRTTYQKGFMVLDMLRFVLGDERFFRSLSHYLKTYQRQTVVTDDFRKAVEEASGENLGWFFDQWVYKAGYPELAVSQQWDESRREVRLTIEQTQALDQMTPLFRMPVDVEFTTAAGSKKVRIEFSRAREEFTFPLDRQPVMTRFDPEGRVLMTMQFSKPAAELLYQLEHDPSVIGRIWAGEQLTFAAGDRAEIARALRERLVRDSFWGVRRAAAAALGQLKTEEARAALGEGLGDRDPRVRQASVRALAAFFKDQQADRLVRRLYDSERNPVTAAEAVFAVGKIQANGAREFLEKALRRDSDQDVIRRYALSGLRDLGDKRGWDIAVRWSRYGNPTQTRIVAVEAFSRLGGRDEKTADLLMALLEDPNLFVRERAIRELGEGGYQKARAALLRIADTEAQSSTRRAAQAALARLGGATRAGFLPATARLLVP